MEDIKNDKLENERANTALSTLNREITLEDLNQQYLQEQVKQGKSVSEIATDFAKAKTTSEIIKNENGKYAKLHKAFAEKQEQTIREGFKQDKIKNQTLTLTEKQKRAEAFYIAYRPILEFDFSHLIKKDKAKNNDEEKLKKYEDRSYGIPLMVLMLCLFTFPFCIISIVLAIFNGINALFEAIATFGKIAKTIVLSICFIAITLLVVYCILLGIDALFGTNILSAVNL